MALIGRLIGKLLKRGSITIVYPDGKRATYGPGDGKTITLRITDRKVLLELVRNPRLALGEAYMDERLVIEDGTILDLFELITRSNRWEDGARGRKLIGKSKLSKLAAVWRRNKPAKARRNVAHHYDLGNELYEIFLDDDLQYSCGYFTDRANSLEQAQADKKAHIAAKLDLKPGQQVLDIGCGWGGMALYLHRIAKVDVLGITLSEAQLKVARQRAKDAGVDKHVRFELIDYRALDGAFDRIVSVGMFEHVGLAHYNEFFSKCRDLLKPDGVMLLHTIGRLGASSGAADPFTDKYIFPGYHLPSLAQATAASAKARLIPADIEILRLHYAYTLRQWLDRTIKARAKIEAMYDARFFRMWESYLAGGIVMFESGSGCNYQIQYVRDRNTLPITRDYMAKAENRYRQADAKEDPAVSRRVSGKSIELQD
jgi:cyclopropane-fatty-acyl-phospholipid synthase